VSFRILGVALDPDAQELNSLGWSTLLEQRQSLRQGIGGWLVDGVNSID
jgi:hypothetical protein